MRGLRRVIVPVPVLAPRLAALWVGLVTPISNRLAVPLIEGVTHPVVADTSRTLEDFPEVTPLSYREAVTRALRQTTENAVTTRWTNALGDTACIRTDPGRGTDPRDQTVPHLGRPRGHLSRLCVAGRRNRVAVLELGVVPARPHGPGGGWAGTAARPAPPGRSRTRRRRGFLAGGKGRASAPAAAARRDEGPRPRLVAARGRSRRATARSWSRPRSSSRSGSAASSTGTSSTRSTRSCSPGWSDASPDERKLRKGR